MKAGSPWIVPDWPAPVQVRAVCTTRERGGSQGMYASFNLAGHVGDDPAAVVANRRRLADRVALPSEPLWLSQVHGCQVIYHSGTGCPGGNPPRADAAFADRPGRVCAVLTADCLPVLFAERHGRCVAAAHAGWRGLAAGVLEATLRALPADPASLLVWLGPAIGAAAFEVGRDVFEAFTGPDPRAAAEFRPAGPGRWHADLYGLARRRLAAAGVRAVHGGGYCTFTESTRFYSYRRDGTTGRMASLIWLE